jgi:hypothetical protein
MINKRLAGVYIAGAAMLMVATPAPVMAQADYPGKPVKLIGG